MNKINGHDFLVVRNSLTNEVKVIAIEECAFLKNGNERLVSQLDISAIDLVTSKIENKEELLKLLICRGLASTLLDDVYIAHRCKDAKNLHNDSNNKLSFLEIIYEEDLYNDNIEMLICMAQSRLLSKNKVIDKENREIKKYASRLISKAVPGVAENSDRLAYSGALLGRIKKVDLGIRNYINSYSYSKDINVKNDKKQKIVERLCNYRTLRDVVMVEKEIDEEKVNDEKHSQKNQLYRKIASYPLLVFAANKIDEYRSYDLGKPYTEEGFLKLEKTKNVIHTTEQTINEEQITFNNFEQKKATIGIGESDLSDYMEDIIKPNNYENSKEIIYSHEIDEELNPFSLKDLEDRFSYVEENVETTLDNNEDHAPYKDKIRTFPVRIGEENIEEIDTDKINEKINTANDESVFKEDPNIEKDIDTELEYGYRKIM